MASTPTAPADPTKAAAYSVLLDISRGLAALWVFTYHFELSPLLRQAHPILQAFVSQGYLGVPMFFVISGYCMMAAARTCLQRHESVAAFLKRRVRRIYPPFWFSIGVALVAPFAMELVSAVKTGHMATPVLGYSAYGVLDWLQLGTLTRGLIQQDPKPAGAFTAVNAVYWTLAIEVQFYGVLAVALAVPRRFSQILLGVTVLSGLFFLLPAPFAYNVFVPWWPMFAMGMGLYEIRRRRFVPMRWLGARTTLVPVIAIVALCAAMAPVLPSFHGAETAFPFCVWFAALLWFAMELEGPLVGGAGRRLVQLGVWLGTISYSIYLIHNRVFYLVAQVTSQAMSADTLVFHAIVMGMTVGVCYIFYRSCERPFIQGRRAPAVVRSVDLDDKSAAREPATG